MIRYFGLLKSKIQVKLSELLGLLVRTIHEIIKLVRVNGRTDHLGPSGALAIIQELQAKGYSALAPHLPTCDASALFEDPGIDTAADVRMTR